MREEKATEEMKRLLIIITLVILSFTTKGQTTPYVIFHPCDLGIGIRFDQQFNDAGLYASLSKGNYKFYGGYLNDHVKMSLGIIAYTKEDAFFTIAINQHAYGDYHFDGEINKNVLSKYSFDLGVGIRINKAAVIIAFDPIKGEGNVGIGIVIR